MGNLGWCILGQRSVIVLSSIPPTVELKYRDPPKVPLLHLCGNLLDPRDHPNPKVELQKPLSSNGLQGFPPRLSDRHPHSREQYSEA